MGFDSVVNSISIQSDGKIIMGGNFTSFNGTSGIGGIVRLNADGARDTTFNTGAGFDGIVISISVQADGKIIMGGLFTSFNGTQNINNIVRLNANGTQDTTFNTGDGFDNDVFTISIQSDGKIIVGGLFTSFNGTSEINSIARLNADGTRDTTFNTGTGFNNPALSTSIQADGKIIVGGGFTSFNNTVGTNHIIRLNANGTQDTTFNTGKGFDNPVLSTSIQADGKIIVGGVFEDFNGTKRSGLVRLLVGASTSISKKVPASQSLQVKIYPNPNNGAFTIAAKSEGVYNIQNGLGQIIQTVTLNAVNSYTINIEDLSSGIYFVTGYNNNMITQQKVVVAK
jgi:uncharacterized delta-60 repeat protein